MSRDKRESRQKRIETKERRKRVLVPPRETNNTSNGLANGGARSTRDKFKEVGEREIISPVSIAVLSFFVLVFGVPLIARRCRSDSLRRRGKRVAAPYNASRERLAIHNASLCATPRHNNAAPRRVTMHLGSKQCCIPVARSMAPPCYRNISLVHRKMPWSITAPA